MQVVPHFGSSVTERAIDFEEVRVETCSCMPVSVLLVQHGVFPMSPTRPKTAVSIDLLEVYRALFERSCDAINALSAALHTIYKRRGFQVVSPQVRYTPSPLKQIFNPACLETRHARERSIPSRPSTSCSVV
jgi:hypothetical protein